MATRILFVDDEAGIRNTLKPILEQHGFKVTTAATVPEALEQINHATFEVLLSDLNIGQPGDGFTVVSAMRRVQPEAATFILTGYPDFDTALQAIRSQVDDYLRAASVVASLPKGERVVPVYHEPHHRMLFAAGTTAVVVSLGLSLSAMFAVGVGVSLLTGRGAIFSGLRQVGIGAAAAIVTFLVGRLIGVTVA